MFSTICIHIVIWFSAWLIFKLIIERCRCNDSSSSTVRIGFMYHQAWSVFKHGFLFDTWNKFIYSSGEYVDNLISNCQTCRALRIIFDPWLSHCFIMSSIMVSPEVSIYGTCRTRSMSTAGICPIALRVSISSLATPKNSGPLIWNTSAPSGKSMRWFS